MKYQVKYNPHSDLANLAKYQLDGIKKKLGSELSGGISLDMQACLISHAFLAEALINMAGYGIFRDKFKEKDPYHKKRRKVLEKLNTDHIEGLTEILEELQNTRNDLAHAKPSRYEVEFSDGEDEFKVFDRPYDKFLNVEFLEKANFVLDSLWVVMGDNELIEEYGMMTTAVEVG